MVSRAHTEQTVQILAMVVTCVGVNAHAWKTVALFNLALTDAAFLSVTIHS